MRLKNVPGSAERIAESRYVIDERMDTVGRWSDIFGNNNPIHIEIGMGKGRFILDMADAHQGINYIGIEMYSSVLIRAVEKMEIRERTNVRFIRMDATYINKLFDKGEVERIYLNFSDPWPKDRHSKRRLNSREFLNRYSCILCANGTLELKTDNELLYGFGLDEVGEAGWRLLYNNNNLHSDELAMQTNIMTEYEEKFSLKGNAIYKYIARPQ